MDINPADLGLCIARHRQRLGWSPDKLAKEIGKSLATIARIESNINLHLFQDITKALQVDPSSLFADDPLI